MIFRHDLRDESIRLHALTIDPYTDVLASERNIIGVSDHAREELVELMEMAVRGEIDRARAITSTVPLDAAAINAVLDDLDRGTTHLDTIISP